MSRLRYIFAGGGTAGHINPALAIAKAVKEKDNDAEILFVGTKKGMEKTLVPKEGFEIVFIDVRGFSREITLTNIASIWKAFTSLFEADRIIKRFKPDVVIGTGGYVSYPVVFRASKRGIPTAIHEQNAYPGVTTRFLSKYADKVMLSFKTARPLKREDNTVMTGNPVRGEILKADKNKARAALGIDGRPLILSFGGSLGALKINEAVVDMLELSAKDGQFNHIHGVGSRDYEQIKNNLDEKHIAQNGEKGITVCEYIYNMPQVMAACDVVVARAGAITLSEIACMGKPSILIPSPNVTDNHQYHNAKTFSENGAAILIKDDELSGRRLYDELINLVFSAGTLNEMSRKAAALAYPKATDEICSIIINLAQNFKIGKTG